ncbi:MAG: hypothetical protein QHH07_09665 [Sedimentisphaerales bacterium]|nr:hypothetical protein [Sedimentisphaerales bacterium]
MRHVTISIAAVILVSAALATAGPNLIVNGSFEQGFDPGEFTTLYNGNTSITG